MTAHDHVRTSAREGAGSSREQAQGKKGGAREKFAEPRGWSLKWDGFALSGMGEQRRLSAK